MATQFVKDFTPPLSSCMFTGNTQGVNPIGSVLHCVTHTPIYCEARNHEKNMKPSPAFTIIRIAQEGWCYSNWKRPKNAKDKTPSKSPDSQPLFEVLNRESLGSASVIKTLKMYQFAREGQFNKGKRDDEKFCELCVGTTIRFNIQTFMYEEKKNGISLFPEGLEVIPEFSMVEITILPQAVKEEQQGYGMKIISIRPMIPTLHSYMTPLGLHMLPMTADSAAELGRRLAKDFPCVSSMVESMNTVFYAKVNMGSYVVEVNKDTNHYRLSAGPDGQVLAGVAEIDVRGDDILRFLNAGSDINSSIYLLDLAMARNALWVLVFRNPYFVKQGPEFLEYRAIPLIDPTTFLDFIQTHVTAGEDSDIQYDIQTTQEAFKGTYGAVNVTPSDVDGVEPTCKDFPITLSGVRARNAYEITIGDELDEDTIKIYYTPAGGAGTKHTCSGGRMDYRALKMRKRNNEK